LSDLLDRYGENHPRIGGALHNVAVANLRAGLLNDAREAIEEAVRIRKVTLGEQNPKVAVSWAFLFKEVFFDAIDFSYTSMMLWRLVGFPGRIWHYTVVYERI
jgi:hypothetical protein